MRPHDNVRFASPIAILFLAALGGLPACSGCGSGGGADDDDGPGGAAASGSGGAAGFPSGGSAGSLPLPTQGAGGGGATLSLRVEPARVALVANGKPISQAFTARLSDGSTPTGVAWSMYDVTLGLVSADGVFTSKGFLSGQARVEAKYGNLRTVAIVDITVNIVEGGYDPVTNPGGLTPAEQAELQEGGGGDGALRFLYPYDATVFPRGVEAPLVQLGGPKATAARLFIEAPGYRYEGFYRLPPPPPPELATVPPPPAALTNHVTLRDEIWKGLTAVPPGEPVRVTATTLVGGQGVGPARQSWSMAPGSLKGIVYYNTYNNTDNTMEVGSGAVMKIKPGGKAEVLLQLENCTVCHSVSSQGNRLVTALGWDDVDLENDEVPNNPIDSGSFELLPDGTTKPKKRVEDGRQYSFGALTPDGSLFLSNAVLGTGENNGPGNEIRGLNGDLRSRLFVTDTGALVPTPSLDALGVRYALSPTFSHDGTLVAFNRRDVNEGRTLSVMSFDGKASPPAFSNLVDLVTRPENSLTPIPAWPSFLPDSKALVYHEGTGFDTYVPDSYLPPNGSKANIRLVELASKRVLELRALNGRRPDGSNYLPFDGDETPEADMNFEPTVLPVPVGGYYWVFFTSRRAYGSLIAPTNGLVPGGEELYGWEQQPSPRKKLWVAAIDIDYAERLALQPGQPGYVANYDPSHPAFYLPGQGLLAGNMRAFAALEPCRQNGSSCESGAECCGGFCRQNGVDANNEPILACVPPPPPEECSFEDELCTTAADCCGFETGAMLCINGRCAQNRPVIR
jgi:hypothetical protein